MNSEEFKEFYRNYRTNAIGSTFMKRGGNPVLKTYEQIDEKIRPHFTGEIPAVLLDSFPNEDTAVKKYRCRIFEPLTLSIVIQAIDDISRCFLSSKYNVSFTNENMTEYLKKKKFNGLKFFQFMFRIFYSRRASSPNAWTLWDVDLQSKGVTDDRFSIDVNPKMLSVKQIEIEKDDELILYKPKIRKKKKHALDLLFENKKNTIKFFIVTDEFFGRVIVGDNGKEQMIVDYVHNLGRLPAIRNGGRPIIRDCGDGVERLIFHSDLMSSVPHLNRYIVAENQEVSIALSSGFPFKFIKGQTCKTCLGRGKVTTSELDPTDPNKLIDCEPCGGNGKVFASSPLHGYIVQGAPEGATKEERLEWARTPAIDFKSPDVGILNYNVERVKMARQRAEEALNIKQQKTYAETEGKARIDNESLYSQLGKISEDVFSKVKESLEIIQGLVFKSVDPIGLTIPTSFDIKNESEMLNEFKECLDGMPYAIRYKLFVDFICKRFHGDEMYIKVCELAAQYSQAYLYTPEELTLCISQGIIKREEGAKAKFAFQLLRGMDTSFLVENMDNPAAIFTKLDELIAPLLPQGTVLDRVGDGSQFNS